jgi:hypothetical protein
MFVVVVQGSSDGLVGKARDGAVDYMVGLRMRDIHCKSAHVLAASSSNPACTASCFATCDLYKARRLTLCIWKGHMTRHMHIIITFKYIFELSVNNPLQSVIKPKRCAETALQAISGYTRT